MTDTSPIGALIVDAEIRAKKKKTDRQHTSEAACGCRVAVSYFTADSRTNRIERCPQHAYPRDAQGRRV